MENLSQRRFPILQCSAVCPTHALDSSVTNNDFPQISSLAIMTGSTFTSTRTRFRVLCCGFGVLSGCVLSLISNVGHRHSERLLDLKIRLWRKRLLVKEMRLWRTLWRGESVRYRNTRRSVPLMSTLSSHMVKTSTAPTFSQQ